MHSASEERHDRSVGTRANPSDIATACGGIENRIGVIGAAALLNSIVTNDALVDGDKRLGWLATAVFLEISGVEISRVSNDDIYDLEIDIAAGQPTVDTIAQRLRQLAT